MANPTYEYDAGVIPANYEPTEIEDLGGMIGKIAFQVIRGVGSFNPLKVFEKKLPENGDTIEQAIVELASARAYDKTGANALTRKTPSLKVKYFSKWNRVTYDTSVDIPQIRKVLQTGKGAAEIATKIVNSLGEGENDETYNQLKNLLKWGRQDGAGKVLKKIATINYGQTGIDYKNFLITLKDTIKGMQFVNADFNMASLKRKTEKEDIVILMPYQLKNRVDVDELAGVFNLEKAEIEKRIIELDTGTETIGGKSTYAVYALDRNAVLNYVRLYDMISQPNGDGYFINYFLHTDKMYALSALFDCGYIEVKAEA